jgi:tetratricopeptide (TPR) repeat protein
MNRTTTNRSARALLTISLTCSLLLLGAALAQVRAGDTLADEGRFAEAVAAYERALATNPNDARAHYRLARSAVYLADELPAEAAADKEAWFARAADAAERAVELAPNDPDAHFEVARALGRLAQFRGVLQSLSLAGRKWRGRSTRRSSSTRTTRPRGTPARCTTATCRGSPAAARAR